MDLEGQQAQKSNVMMKKKVARQLPGFAFWVIFLCLAFLKDLLILRTIFLCLWAS